MSDIDPQLLRRLEKRLNAKLNGVYEDWAHACGNEFARAHLARLYRERAHLLMEEDEEEVAQEKVPGPRRVA